MSKRLHGADAVAKARELLGRPLSASEAHIASVEGYSLETYDDTKGVKTVGFGQTGEFSGMPFDEVVSTFENRTRGIIPAYDSLPEALQLRLLDSTYRGGISGSEDTLKHVNAGRWQEAATEFLDHGDFRNSQAGNGAIAERMQTTSDAMKNYGDTLYEEALVRKEQYTPAPRNTEGVSQTQDATFPSRSGVPVIGSSTMAIPPTAQQDPSRTYQVAKGDTLSQIARDSGMTVDQLVAHNGISNPDQIQVGQTIQLVPEIKGLTSTGVSSSGRQIYDITDKIPKSTKDTFNTMWSTLFGD